MVLYRVVVSMSERHTPTLRFTEYPLGAHEHYIEAEKSEADGVFAQGLLFVKRTYHQTRKLRPLLLEVLRRFKPKDLTCSR